MNAPFLKKLFYLLTLLNIIIIKCEDTEKSPECLKTEFWNGQRCAKCQEGCTCKNYNTCDSCIDQYSFYDSNRKRCSNGIDTACSIYTNECYQIKTGCFNQQFKQLVALTCKESYRLGDFSNCQQCKVNYCKECSDSVNICSQCLEGYTKINDILCTQCVSNCKDCGSISTCSECYGGYFLNDEEQCIPCSVDGSCIECSNNNECTKCAQSYFLNNKKCEFCGSLSIKKCLSPNQIIQCQQYSTSNKWALYALINGNCIASSIKNAQACQQFDIDGNCIKCYSPYAVSKGNCQNMKNCINFQEGNIFNTANCSACSSGYLLDPNDKMCYYCQTQYFIENQQCIACETRFPYCRECNSSQCIKCNLGRFLLASQCTGFCRSTCRECTSEGNCLECKLPYMYKLQNGECDLDQNCINTKNGLCSACKTGYILNQNNQCQQCNSQICSSECKSNDSIILKFTTVLLFIILLYL